MVDCKCKEYRGGPKCPHGQFRTWKCHECQYEIGVKTERERCAKIADELSLAAGNDAAGGIAHAIAQKIREDK